MTLNQIGEDIAFKLGDQFNNTLRESIKHTVILYRAKYLKDDLSKSRDAYMDYIQSIKFQLERVNLVEDLGVEICCAMIAPELNDDSEYFAYKVIGRVLNPLRIKGFGKNGFKYVGNSLRTRQYSFTYLENYKSLKLLPYGEDVIYYTKIGDTYYVLSDLDNLCDIVFDAIYDNPREVATVCNPDKFMDDVEFPIALDFLMSITKNIVSGDYPVYSTDGEEVNIQSNVKQERG